MGARHWEARRGKGTLSQAASVYSECAMRCESGLGQGETTLAVTVLARKQREAQSTVKPRRTAPVREVSGQADES